jgi:hypothetical protein
LQCPQECAFLHAQAPANAVGLVPGKCHASKRNDVTQVPPGTGVESNSAIVSACLGVGDLDEREARGRLDARHSRQASLASQAYVTTGMTEDSMTHKMFVFEDAYHHKKEAALLIEPLRARPIGQNIESPPTSHRSLA